MKKLLFLLFLPVAIFAQSNTVDPNKYLFTRIVEMERQIDSLKKVNENNYLKFQALQKQEDVYYVNAFYDSAWNRLVILLGILAVAVPLIIQWMQQRNFKNSEKRIFKELDKRFNDKLLLLQNESNAEIKRLTGLFENKINDLSTSHEESIKDLNLIFDKKTKKLKKKFVKITDIIHGDLYASIAILFDDDEDTIFSAAMFLVSSYYKCKQRLSSSKVTLERAKEIIENIEGFNLEDFDEQINKLHRVCENYNHLKNEIIKYDDSEETKSIIDEIDKIIQKSLDKDDKPA